jgi:hypothetical protein
LGCADVPMCSVLAAGHTMAALEGAHTSQTQLGAHVSRMCVRCGNDWLQAMCLHASSKPPGPPARTSTDMARASASWSSSLMLSGSAAAAAAPEPDDLWRRLAACVWKRWASFDASGWLGPACNSNSTA